MALASHICTACGYEGSPIRPPSDAGGEDESFLIGFFNKLFFMMTFIPIKFNGIARMLKRGKAKHCPNCGLPLMVKLSSDAGWLAKRKIEIRMGLVVVDEHGHVREGTGPRQLLPTTTVAPADPGVLPPLQSLLEQLLPQRALNETTAPVTETPPPSQNESNRSIPTNGKMRRRTWLNNSMQ